MMKALFEDFSGRKLTAILSRLRSLGLRGGLAVLDQGLFSGSNFLLNVFIARWLSPAEYGAFSLAFALYIFSTGFYNAIILEPISVLGPARYSDRLSHYLADQIVLHIYLTVALGLLVLSAAWALYYFKMISSVLFQSFTGMGLCLPLLLFIWFARRCFYILQQPHGAVVVSLIYSILLIGGSVLLRTYNVRNTFFWWGVYGISSLTGLIILARLPRMFGKEHVSASAGWKGLLSDQWAYSKWIVLAACLNFSASQIQIFVAASFLGLGSAGAFRALQNYYLPMTQVLGAIYALSLPSIAYSYGKQDFDTMKRRSFMVGGVLLVASLMYGMVLLLGSRWIENLLYGGRYSAHSWLIPVMGLIPLISALEMGFCLVVRALQRSQYYAVLNGSMALVGILSAIVLIPRLGMTGAAVSLISTALCSSLINIWYYHKWFFRGDFVSSSP